MTSLDVLRFATGALRGHGLRTGLSMLGVAIGVASVVLLTALGEGARTYVTEQFASLGTNVLIIVPGRTETTGAIPGLGGVPRDLTIADAETIGRRVHGIQTLAPAVIGNETVSHGERARQVIVVATTAEMQAVRRIVMRSGRFLPPGEWDRGAPVALIGHKLRAELFPGVEPIGRVIRIGDFRMRVGGVMAQRGVSLGLDLDNIVIIPLATGMRLFNRTSLFRILAQLHPRADAEVVAEAITAVLKERHDGEEDFTLITQDAVMSAFSSIFSALTMALAAIAAVSLTVAGIGIMNVMLVSVSERTSEIGLLRAVGAHPSQILAAFLTEAVILALAGGLIGLSIAWLAVQGLLAVFPAIPAAAPLWAVVASLLVSIVVGAVFGVIPARQATRLDPIAALR